ncbi:MAG: hypothetical protein F4Y02_17975 [Chloroflexi bacterium]|nr:hypothetical protein [Chloroflexota bacterium]
MADVLPMEGVTFTPPKRPPARRVRALIVLDPMGTSAKPPELEYIEIRDDYRDFWGLHLDAERADTFRPDRIGVVDLIVFDWGGMAVGNSMLQHQLRYLLRWAEDHPSALVVIHSATSWRFLRWEIEDHQLPDLANVVFDGEVEWDPPDWWLHALPLMEASDV